MVANGGQLHLLPSIITNYLYSKKDSSNIANIIKIRKEKNDLSQPFRLAWNLRPILTPRRCRWAIFVTAFQAEWYGRILATSLSGSSQSLKGSYRYSLWHRHRLIGASPLMPEPEGLEQNKPGMSPCVKRVVR